ncbi:MAG: hypothetical protein IH958_02640 [Chloroflexi bacterium]|nr:hypothetical protein [Chloroflexota bacterium]
MSYEPGGDERREVLAHQRPVDGSDRAFALVQVGEEVTKVPGVVAHRVMGEVLARMKRRQVAVEQMLRLPAFLAALRSRGDHGA